MATKTQNDSINMQKSLMSAVWLANNILIHNSGTKILPDKRLVAKYL